MGARNWSKIYNWLEVYVLTLTKTHTNYRQNRETGAKNAEDAEAAVTVAPVVSKVTVQLVESGENKAPSDPRKNPKKRQRQTEDEELLNWITNGTVCRQRYCWNSRGDHISFPTWRITHKLWKTLFFNLDGICQWMGG